jgi:hypothetical protein
MSKLPLNLTLNCEIHLQASGAQLQRSQRESKEARLKEPMRPLGWFHKNEEILHLSEQIYFGAQSTFCNLQYPIQMRKPRFKDIQKGLAQGHQADS